MLYHTKQGWAVKSSSGKKFLSSKDLTKEEALKRLRQIEHYKHVSTNEVFTANAQPQRTDPSKTGDIRRSWVRESNARFRDFKKALVEFLVKEDELALKPSSLVLHGGPGSGNFGHGGRPGEVGGSAPTSFSLESKSGGAEMNKTLGDIRDEQIKQVGGDTAWRSYLHGGKDGFADINKTLREGGKSDVAGVFEKASKDFADINKTVAGDGYVYRGLKNGKLLKDGELLESGLLSTSLNPKEAGNFATEKGKAGIVLRIKPSEGSRAVIGATPQREVVFTPGHTLKVVGKSETKVKFSGDYGEKEVLLYDVILIPPKKDPSPATHARRYEYQTSAQKLEAFSIWLDDQMDAKLLSKGKGIWAGKYIDSAYKRGIVRAYTDVHAGRLGGMQKGMANATKAEFLRSTMAVPERIDSVQLLATRSFEGMKGLSSRMKTKMNFILANGLANGEGPAAMAREMVDSMDIEQSRAETIARTETAHAQAEGQLTGYEELGVEEVGLQVEFLTAGDDRVCEKCQELADGGPYSVEDARGMIPAHANCRCAWAPITMSPEERRAAGITSNSTVVLHGGPGSGNFGHAGRPGERGGSAPAGGGSVDYGDKEGSNRQRVADIVPDRDGLTIEEMTTKAGVPEDKVQRVVRTMMKGGYLTKDADGKYRATDKFRAEKRGGPVTPTPTPVPVAPPTVQPSPVVEPVVEPAPSVTPDAQPEVKGTGGEREFTAAEIKANPGIGKGRFNTAKEYREQILASAPKQSEADKQKLKSLQDSLKADTEKRDKDYASYVRALKDAEYRKLSTDEREKDPAVVAAWNEYQKNMSYARRAELHDEVRKLQDSGKISNEAFFAALQEENSAKGIMGYITRPTGLDVDKPMDKVLGMVPRNTLSEKDIQRMQNLKYLLKQDPKETSSSYYHEGQYIRLSHQAAKHSLEKTTIHEYSHHMQWALPDVMEKNNNFYNERSKGSSVKALSGYSRGIRGVDDNWTKAYGSAYAGRWYDAPPGTRSNWESPEVFTCGMELLTRNPSKFAADDPEWFDATVSMLKRIPVK